jgi:SAM-dependent methyltransferase
MISCIIYSYMNLVPYWRNKNIHNLGNTGALGNLHAVTAPFMTKFIDRAAYGGRNIREEVYNSLDGSVLDMCCGTGFSTKPGCVGIDTSLEMLRFSKLFNPGSDYSYGNAETFGSNEEFDTVSIMFSFHEMPRDAHRNIIRNAIRVARKKVVLVDISQDYKPTTAMLSGEPYLLDYLDTFQTTIDNIIWKEETNTAFPIFHLPRWNKTILVDKHVDMWEYNKPSKYSMTTDNVNQIHLDHYPSPTAKPIFNPKHTPKMKHNMRWSRRRALKRAHEKEELESWERRANKKNFLWNLGDRKEIEKKRRKRWKSQNKEDREILNAEKELQNSWDSSMTEYEGAVSIISKSSMDRHENARKNLRNLRKDRKKRTDIENTQRKDKIKKHNRVQTDEELKEMRAKAWDYFMGGDIEAGWKETAQLEIDREKNDVEEFWESQ